MTPNRAAEFAALAAAAIDPAYRRLWASQAETYGGNGQAAPVTVDPKPQPGPAFRLPAESDWARLFDALGVAWKYEGRFFFPDRAAWLKVLSQPPTPAEFAAARALVGEGRRVYMVTGWPARKRFGVWVFSEAGEFMAVRADFRDLAIANLLGVSFGKLWEAMEPTP